MPGPNDTPSPCWQPSSAPRTLLHQHSNKTSESRNVSSGCSFYERVGSSLPSLALPLPYSLKIIALSSPRPKSLVLIIPLCPPSPYISLPHATTTDPTTECTPYAYAPVTQVLQTFPPIWEPATLFANDTAGQALWAKIAGSIPNTAPKGKLTGSTKGVTYDSSTDPDCCEWYFFPRLAVCATIKGRKTGLAWRVARVSRDMRSARRLIYY
jgi:hypothetical protein